MSQKKSKNKLMKDGLDKNAIERIATMFSQVAPKFNKLKFKKDAINGLSKLELKERVQHLIEVLHQHLPSDFKQAAPLLNQIQSVWDSGDGNDKTFCFAAWPIIDYVGVYGRDHPKIALKTLKKLTALFSAEFAIRPFLKKHEQLTLKEFHTWVHDKDPHVRRLVSEGSRPRLPWGEQLQQYIQNPLTTLTLLEKLKDDPSEYVRRSVANHLNDISKDHPHLVVKICKSWKINGSAQRQALIRHATRTLVKTGHSEVFSLLDYTTSPKVKIKKFTLSPKEIYMGNPIHINLEVVSQNQKKQSFVLDYAIHHVKASGQTSSKVFKLKNVTIEPAVPLKIKKSHVFKQISTRKYYAGKHAVEILINGKAVQKLNFILKI